MKATELLTTQHQEVNALFEQIEQAEGEAVRPLVEQLVANIVAHSMIEKEIYYVAAAEVPENAKLLRESFEEHALVEFTMQKLLNAEPGDETFHARVTVLKELLQHHMQEEQEELFPKTDRALAAEQMEELGQVMEQRFELLKAGDVRKMLAEAVQEAMPRTTTTRRRSQAAKQSGRRTGTRAASKRTTGQRASGGGRTTTKRSTTAKRSTAAKRSSGGQGTGSRASTSTSTGRKQSASKSGGGSKSARGAQSRSNASRTQRQAAGAKGGRRSGGRSSSSR